MIRVFAVLSLLVALAACDDDPTPVDPRFLLEDLSLPPTRPENLVRSIEVLYNDKVHHRGRAHRCL